MNKVNTRVFGLDFIRAIAILLVLCSHSVVLLAPESNASVLFAIKFFGTIGVDVFFVLSGFLIGGILLKLIDSGQTDFKSLLYFWIRRWFRTLPNYYLILCINILLVYVFFNKPPLDIINYFFFLQNFNSQQSDFFTESWSLSIEEFAYVILPLGLFILSFLTKKVTSKTFLWLSVFCVLLITLNRCYFDQYLANSSMEWSGSLRKVVVYRIDSIYYGFFGAYIFKYYKNTWQNFKYSSAIFGATIFLLVHSYIVIEGLKPTVESAFFNIFYLPLVSISILLFFPWLYNFKISGILNNLITKISLWSYSLYLVNYSIVLLSLQYFFNIEDFSVIESVFCLASFWMISFILAFLVFHFYEIPLTRLRDSETIKRRFQNKN